MFSFFTKSFLGGTRFIRDNPGLLYSLFLLLIIPISFLFVADRFLRVASSNQERIERENVGVLHDVLARFVVDSLDDSSLLQKKIEDIGRGNQYMREFKVVSWDGSQAHVVASLRPQEIGTDDDKNIEYYRSAGLNTAASLIFEEFEEESRLWKSVRAVVDEHTVIRGFIFTNFSMARVDDISAKNIESAYYLLILIVLLVFSLLLRHARIIDYAALYRKLEEVDRMKDDFVSMAAHELRTPLSLIRNYAETIGHTSNLSEENRKALANIDLFSKNLNFLIGDILDVSKLEQGKMAFSLEVVDIRTIVAKDAEPFQKSAEAKGLSFRVILPSDPLFVKVDAEKLHEVLVNLIGNAVKYTFSGGVTVRLSEIGKRIEVRVGDTGIGISAEDQQKLFGKFSRIRTKETAEISGTGLGLWITKSIVESMGGRIGVESIKGKGSDFTISFPKTKS